MKRDDDSTQVTDNGSPLYLYVSDKQADDASGNELDQFGAEWERCARAATRPRATAGRWSSGSGGKYEFYCPVDNHKQMGLEGEITVQVGAARQGAAHAIGQT